MKFLGLSFCIVVLLGCQRDQAPKQSLKEGDILFQDMDCGGLCDAIEAVTDGVDGRDFSHCGLVVEKNDSLFVLEAIGTKVEVIPLASFFARTEDNSFVRNIVATRVKPEYEKLLKKAVHFATLNIDQPYDDAFLMNNGKWYCSELLYEAFKQANNDTAFFDLAPMTFKDPTSNTFFPAWVDYYKAIHAEIPEGQPGLNPGGISRSDKLFVLEQIEYPKYAYKR